MDFYNDKEISFTGLIRVFIRNFRIFISIFIAFVFFALIYSLVAPYKYISTAVILDEQDNSSDILGSIAGNLPIDIGATKKSDPKLVLSSNSLASYVYKKLDLDKQKDFSKIETMDEKLATLKDMIKISSSGMGDIRFTVETNDPVLSYDIANAYLEGLELLLARLYSVSAKRKVAYLSEKLIKVENELRIAQEKLIDFQRRNKIWDMSSQTGKIISEMNSLVAEKERILLSAETEEKLLGTKDGLSLNDRGRLQAIDVALQKYQKELERIGSLALEYAQLSGEVEAKKAIYTYLTTQMEQANLQQMDEAKVFPVIDYPTVPERRSWPKRKYIVIVGSLIGFFFGIISVFFVDFIRRIKRDLERGEE